MNKTLYGGVTGAAGSKTSSGKTETENTGGWKGIVWVILALVLGALVYAFAASGRGKDALRKWKRTFQEMGGGLFGGRKQDGGKE